MVKENWGKKMRTAKEAVDEFKKMIEVKRSEYPKTNVKIRKFKYKIVEIL